MGNQDHSNNSMTACTFKALQHPSDTPGRSVQPCDEACEQFRPLYRCDGSTSSGQPHLKGEALAAYLEEVHHCAAERGRQEGLEEARRLAQASLLPHLRSVVDRLGALTDHVQAAEESGSKDAITLAMTVVEQVIGVSADGYDLEEVSRALRGFIAHNNRYQFLMNRDDLQYLKEMMNDNRLAWPDHPSLAIESDPGLERGCWRLAPLGDSAAAVDAQAADHMEAFLSRRSRQTG